MGWKSHLKKFVMGNLVRKESVPVPVLHGDFLKGRCALITGGTSGIGYSIAESFIENGCEVVITGRSEERILRAVSLLERKGRAHGVVLDSACVDSFAVGIREAIELTDGKRIDILVNNAGINKGNGFGSTVDEWDAVMDTNLRGVFFLSQEVAQYMKDQGIEGNILNISSSSALRPADRPYSLSKWGLRGLTLGLAKTLIPYGIVVNALAPGQTATPMLQGGDAGYLENDEVPANRYIAPEEIANLAVILVSSLGRMIVGDTVYMTGGSGLITFEDMDYDF